MFNSVAPCRPFVAGGRRRGRVGVRLPWCRWTRSRGGCWCARYARGGCGRCRRRTESCRGVRGAMEGGWGTTSHVICSWDAAHGNHPATLTPPRTHPQGFEATGGRGRPPPRPHHGAGPRGRARLPGDHRLRAAGVAAGQYPRGARGGRRVPRLRAEGGRPPRRQAQHRLRCRPGGGGGWSGGCRALAAGPRGPRRSRRRGRHPRPRPPRHAPDVIGGCPVP